MKKKCYLWLLTALLAMALCFGGCADETSSGDEETRKEQSDEKSDEDDEKKDDEKSESEEKSKSVEKSESVEEKDNESSEVKKEDETFTTSEEDEDQNTEEDETTERKTNGGEGVTDPAIIGKWVSEPIESLTQKFLDELEGLDEMREFVELDRNKILFCIYFEFTADGIMHYGMEEESLKNTMDYIASSLIGGMKPYIEKLLKEAGMEMSYEDYLIAVGMTEEEYEKQLRDELYKYLDEDDVNAEGIYAVKDGRLYACEADEKKIDFDHTESLSYTISGDKLAFLTYFDENGQRKSADMMDDLFTLPITLTRK